MKNHILVTGGAGYIGSHTCKALSLAGYTPVAYDNLVYGHRRLVKWGPFEEGDISDEARLREVINQYRPTAVMHFAAFAYVGESVENPGKYYRNNLAGTLTLLETIRNCCIKYIIFSSSCATYGISDDTFISETHPQNPVNPYGQSKLMVEQMLRDFDHAHGIKSVALRYFNAAGADPEVESGEDHIPETHLIPLVLDVAIGKRPHITVYGDDHATRDGTCIRDYIHVSDLANAHMLALKALESGMLSNAFNLGNGVGYSVREIISASERVTGMTIPTIIGARRHGDPSHLLADARKAMSQLGWKPQYGDIDTIIEHAWNFHKTINHGQRLSGVQKQ